MMMSDRAVDAKAVLSVCTERDQLETNGFFWWTIVSFVRFFPRDSKLERSPKGGWYLGHLPGFLGHVTPGWFPFLFLSFFPSFFLSFFFFLFRAL